MFEETATATSADDVTAYAPPDKKVMLHFRAPASTKRGIADTARLWKIYAVERGDDPDEIDPTYVLNRFLTIQLDQAFGEVGIDSETRKAGITEEQWLEIQKLIKRSLKK